MANLKNQRKRSRTAAGALPGPRDVRFKSQAKMDQSLRNLDAIAQRRREKRLEFDSFNGFIQYLQNLHLIDDVNTHVIEPFSTESIHAIAAGHANPPDLVPISEAERQPTPNPEILPLPQPEPAIEPQRNLECVVSSARPRPKPKRISRPATSALASFETQGDSVSKLAASIPRILNERVTSEDMQCLISPTKWLNDEIINFYGALIQTQSNAGGDGCLRVHVFSTFFFNQLEAGYKEKRVARWTRKFDIFAKDCILIPVNHDNVHWSAACINFRKKRIESYDSLTRIQNGVYDRRVCKLLRQYLELEHQDKKKASFDFTDWIDYVPKTTPQQDNSYDCGVFTSQHLKALSYAHRPCSFTQADMATLRQSMIREITCLKLES